jgi:20S proteasome alpha/beta subunit
VLGVQVRGRRTAVLAARRRPLGPLVEASSVPAVHKVCAGVGCCAVGVAGDALRQVAALRSHAQAFRARYGHAPPVAVLAQLLADDAQRASLTGETRPLGATTLIIGCDYGGGGGGAAVCRVEPTGQFYRCRAAAGGRACDDAAAWLAAHLPGDLPGDAAAAVADATEADATEAAALVQVALQCLLQATPREPESDSLSDHCSSSSSSSDGACVDDFQVGVASAAVGFRFLTTAELAAALKAAEGATGSERTPRT